ncbi:MAG: hypothetical protein ACI4DK_05720 [Lachnospiraceae bacterium]
MEIIKKITKWYVTITICSIFSICALVYFDAIVGLAKPAGLVEAFKFMFASPKEYMLCLLCGGLAKTSFAAMFVVAVASLVLIIKSVYEYKTEYEAIDWKAMICYIINVILAIVLGIIQNNIISNFWILLIAVGLLILGIKVWADNN